MCTIIYSKSKNISEVSITFIVGLIAVYTINWEWKIFLIFVLSFICFLIICFFVSSIQLASKVQKITVLAANFIDPYDESIPKKLNRIINKKTKYGYLGPIDKAEAIRYMSFRNIPIDEMTMILESSELLSAITEVSILKIVEFLTDIRKIEDLNRDNLDFLFKLIREIEVSPEEFFEIFSRCKKFVLTRKVSFRNFLQIILHLSKTGIRPEEYPAEMERLINDDLRGLTNE